MTTEEKDLLIKDLSARLPYEVECKVTHDFREHRTIVGLHPIKEFGVLVENNCHNPLNPIDVKFEDIKPYLFPLSSMTEEQRKELNELSNSVEINGDGDTIGSVFDAISYEYYYTSIADMLTVIDWLNRNHFDYRGLIEKGLALDATGLNIY